MLNTSGYATKSQRDIQYILDLQKKLRRLIRKEYDKDFMQKHGSPRRKGREDHVLLLKYIHKHYASGDLDYKEVTILAEKYLLRIKGLHAKGAMKQQDFEQGMLIVSDIRASILSSYRIGGSDVSEQ